MSKASTKTLGRLSEEFRWFARAKCRGCSPLYESLSSRIARDEALLSMAADANSPAPNILFGAVHFLLLKGVQNALADFYPSLSDKVPSTTDPYPLFRSFCLDHRDEIKKIISTRFVQTNEVRRCSFLFPAFCYISFLAGGKALTILEIGTSAGLNLIPDLYRYNYGGKIDYGDLDCPVRIETSLRGGKSPCTDSRRLHILHRVGLDLNPVDRDNQEDVLWLRALIWPERRERVDLLSKAMHMVEHVPMTLLAGDAVELLPEILPLFPVETALCIYHTYTLNQFSPEARRLFFSIIQQWGSRLELYHLSCEWGERHPQLQLVSYRGGVRTKHFLAYCDLHGNWIEWRAAHPLP